MGPRVPTQIILCQIPEEKRQIEKVQENSAEDSSTLADDPAPANAAAAQAIHELEQVLGPQTSTSSSLEKQCWNVMNKIKNGSHMRNKCYNYNLL